MSKLVLHLPNGTMRDIRLDRDHITIGRRADNDICLPYPAVSAEHAVVITVLTDSFLQDMGSTNGTLVNGNRINKHFLLDHDAIDIGRVQLVYLMDEAESVAALAPAVPGNEIGGVPGAVSDADRTTSVDTDPEPAFERDRARFLRRGSQPGRRSARRPDGHEFGLVRGGGHAADDIDGAQHCAAGCGA